VTPRYDGARGVIGTLRRLTTALCATAVFAHAALAGDWAPLAKDGIHDPKNPGIRLLQEPRQALSRLPPDTTGNQVRWIEAIDRDIINPRTNLFPETKIQVLDKDILMDIRGGMPMVLFPHRQHTLWLDCSNCHEQLFKSQVGANRFSMFQMLQGEQCGQCHGAVAFPLTECNRCHSIARTPSQQAPPQQ
jgi:c(7)-type cytochrome triheme protein